VPAQRQPGADDPGPRRVGFFAQSGSLGVALLERARSRNLGLSTFVSAGNRADVSGNDLLQYWATDPATEVVLLHLESFGNPRKFARLARSVGRHQAGRRGEERPARHGHRGLAGTSVAVPEQSVAALFASAGVIRVETVAQMFDVGTLLAHQPLPEGKRVAIVGNSTAIGVLIADAVLDQGLELARRRSRRHRRRRHARGLSASPCRPPSTTTAWDAVVAVFLPAADGRLAGVRPGAARGGRRSAKPIVASFLSDRGHPARAGRPRRDGMPARGSVPSYSTPERAVIALAKVAEYARWRRRPVGELPELPDVDDGAGRRSCAASSATRRRAASSPTTS
jgi:acyl-CoA synthetase (NDP forming)